MTDSEKEKLIRAYAAGQVTWHALQERGFDNYVQVLGGLGELGLRSPIAPMVFSAAIRQARRCCCSRTAMSRNGVPSWTSASV
jgi:hypothetical protein